MSPDWARLQHVCFRSGVVSLCWSRWVLPQWLATTNQWVDVVGMVVTGTCIRPTEPSGWAYTLQLPRPPSFPSLLLCLSLLVSPSSRTSSSQPIHVGERVFLPNPEPPRFRLRRVRQKEDKMRPGWQPCMLCRVHEGGAPIPGACQA